MTSTAGAGWRARIAERRAQEGVLDVLFVPIVLFGLVLYLSATTDVFFTSGNVENVLHQGAILAMVAFAVTLVVISGEFDLSVGATVALAGVVGAKVMNTTDSVLLGFLVSIGVGTIVGLVNGVLVAYVQVPSFIVTLGTLTIGRGLALAMTDGGTVTGLPEGVGFFGDTDVLGLSMLIWLTVAVFGVIWFVQRQTTLGVRIFATGGNREAARLAGVPVPRVRLTVFVISGTAAGVAGMALLSRVESGQPTAAQLLELFAVAAVVVGGTSLFGGRGSVTRTLFGVLLITVLQNGLDIKGIQADIQQVVIGSVLIASASVDFVRRQVRRRRAVAIETSPGDGEHPAAPDAAPRAPLAQSVTPTTNHAEDRT